LIACSTVVVIKFSSNRPSIQGCDIPLFTAEPPYGKT
jgi:hypothetical protein